MNTKDLQRGLIQLGYDLGPAGADGVFGRVTQAAVRAFQADYRVSVQWPGTVGPKTESALATAVSLKTGAPVVAPTGAPLIPWMEEAQRLKGVKEVVGKGSNATILKWAAAIGGWVKSYFTDDDIPWCGLFVAHCIGATLSNEPLPSNPLGALNWKTFGVASKPAPGAILVFRRSGGGHVGFYVGEDATAYHVLGGNQSNAVNVTRVAKDRHEATRWPISATLSAAGPVHLTTSGALSTNEA